MLLEAHHPEQLGFYQTFAGRWAVELPNLDISSSCQGGIQLGSRSLGILIEAPAISPRSGDVSFEVNDSDSGQQKRSSTQFADDFQSPREKKQKLILEGFSRLPPAVKGK